MKGARVIRISPLMGSILKHTGYAMLNEDYPYRGYSFYWKYYTVIHCQESGTIISFYSRSLREAKSKAVGFVNENCKIVTKTFYEIAAIELKQIYNCNLRLN